MKIANHRGFTLIEVLVVASLTVMMAVILIRNFSNRKFDFDRIANNVEADIRLAQTYALASKQLGGAFRCGYGITWVNSTAYNIYAGGDSSANNCTPSFTFSSPGTTPIAKTVLMHPEVQILQFQDSFYLPPDPRLYIGASSSGAISPNLITLKKTSALDCSNPNDCRYICIYPPGRVEIYRSSSLCN